MAALRPAVLASFAVLWSVEGGCGSSVDDGGGGATAESTSATGGDAGGAAGAAGTTSTGGASTGGSSPCGDPCADCAPVHQWSLAFGGSGQPYAQAVAIGPDDSILFAGFTDGLLQFGADQLTSPGANSIVVAKLGSDASPLWARMYGGPEPEGAYAVAVDGDGSVVVAGFSSGAIDFGAGSIDGRVFLLKLGADGDHVWSRAFPAADQPLQLAKDVAIDATGDILLTGEFAQWIDLGGGPLPGTDGSNAASDVFLARFDAAGNHLWSRA